MTRVEPLCRPHGEICLAHIMWERAGRLALTVILVIYQRIWEVVTLLSLGAKNLQATCGSAFAGWRIWRHTSVDTCTPKKHRRNTPNYPNQ